MPITFLKYLAIFVIALAVFVVSFFGTTILTCYLNPEFDRVLWVKIDPPDD